MSNINQTSLNELIYKAIVLAKSQISMNQNTMHTMKLSINSPSVKCNYIRKWCFIVIDTSEPRSAWKPLNRKAIHINLDKTRTDSSYHNSPTKLVCYLAPHMLWLIFICKNCFFRLWLVYHFRVLLKHLNEGMTL